MSRVFLTSWLCLLGAPLLLAQPSRNAAKIFDDQLQSVESEFVSLVEAMPAEKFNFAPSDGAFKGVRTFGMQAKHAAYVLNEVASGLLNEKNPSKTGANENGPEELTSKEEILQYVKDAFAYVHRAFGALTEQNLLEEMRDPFDGNKRMVRLKAANVVLWHTFDHYGQMVVYARMNHIVPPASR